MSTSEEMTLASAYRKFLAASKLAAGALKSPTLADQYHVAIVRDLYHFLTDNDFTCDVLLGMGFKKPLVNAAKSITEDLEDHGYSVVADHLEHAVVKVNQLIIDPSYSRLGTSYETRDNYPVRDFYNYWELVKPIKHLLDLTPLALADRIKNMQEPAHASTLLKSKKKKAKRTLVINIQKSN